MSGGANKLFKQDPATFLRDHVILAREGGMPPVAGAYKVNLRPAPLDQVTAEDGRILPVYVPYLAEKVPGYGEAGSKDRAKGTDKGIKQMQLPGKSSSLHSHQFKAFFLPWAPNATHVVDLDDRADYLFTPGLTGCSFAATSTGKPRAGHFNYLKRGEDKVSPRKTKKAVRTEFGGAKGVSTKRSDYIQDDGELQRYLFIVGWRDGKVWRFFRQHLEFAGTGKGTFYKRLAAPSEIDNSHRFRSP